MFRLDAADCQQVRSYSGYLFSSIWKSIMPTHFDLIITANYPSHTADFRLLDAHGAQLAYRQTEFKTITIGHRQGLFDLRNTCGSTSRKGKKRRRSPRSACASRRKCWGRRESGFQIFEKLWQSESQRTLRIQLPGAAEEENHLAAALARVPWEIARPKRRAGDPGRAQPARPRRPRHAGPDLASRSNWRPTKPLRVLFVFAEARGSRPLGAREERRELLRLFEKEIYPQRRVVAHFLTHGVTRERLEAQIRGNNGYHVVHWSGHGHLNLLELAKPGGAQRPSLRRASCSTCSPTPAAFCRGWCSSAPAIPATSCG